MGRLKHWQIMPYYKGYWNANTNTPTIIDGVGDEEDWYRVSVDGGIFKKGDDIWYHNGAWIKRESDHQPQVEPPLVTEYADFVAGTAKDYVLLLSAIYPFTIDSFWAEVDDGSIGVSLKIGSTAITGIDGATVDTTASQVDATAANSVAIGDRVVFSLSATYTGAPTLIRIQIKTTRV